MVLCFSGGEEVHIIGVKMRLKRYLVESIPFAAMVMVECLDVGMATLSKAAMSRGMSHFVFVVYSNALASAILLPSSFIFNGFNPFFPFQFSLAVSLFPFTSPPVLLICLLPLPAEKTDLHFLSRFSANSSSSASLGM